MGLFSRKDKGHEKGHDHDASMPLPVVGTQAGTQLGMQVDMAAMQRQAEQMAAQMRQQAGARPSLSDVLRYAKEAQQQGIHQMQAVQEAQNGGGGVGAILAALGMNWNSDYIRRIDCPTCGGPKQLPSPSAYVYCDYCSSLCDYDFRRACEDSMSSMPGPAYVQLINSSQQELQSAKAAGDVDRYRGVQLRIFDAYVQASPKACSHRINDPQYRDQLVRYMAESSVVCDFDPQYSALMNEMKAAVVAIPWSGGMRSPKTGGAAFRAVVDVCERQQARAGQVLAAAGIADMDPDHASQAVRERMAHSLFAQGWLPMLEQEDAAWLVHQLKLNDEYTPIKPPVNAQDRNCGSCGGDLVALAGAKTIICNHCGKSIDVGGAQAGCGGCGATLSFPVGIARMPCPYCKAEAERVGWT